MVSQNNHDLGTRERILAVSAALFARRGYHGTSTRHISTEVGIRQPSLFHHFASKREILIALLDRDLSFAVANATRFVTSHEMGTPACRLYALILSDLRWLVESPYDARGLYNDFVLEEDTFAEQRAMRAELHRLIREVIEQGIASQELRPIDPRFARQTITALYLDTIRAAGAHVAEDLTDRPRAVAEFVLRGLLADPAGLETVTDSGTRLAEI